MTWPTANPCFRRVSSCVEKMVDSLSINNTIFVFIAYADLFCHCYMYHAAYVVCLYPHITISA